MTKVKVGDFILIKSMRDEDPYTGKFGEVSLIDDLEQIHGTWGGCALVSGVDEFDIISKERFELYRMCDETNTNSKGMDMLVDYYISSLNWSEEKACNYAISLFKNETIQAIKFLGKDGKEL